MTKRKFIEISLPDDDGTSRDKSAHHLGILSRHSLRIQSACGSGPHASSIDVVLQRYGNSVKRAKPVATPQIALCGVSLSRRALSRHGDECVYCRIQPFDSFQAEAGQLKRRDGSFPHKAACVLDGKPSQVTRLAMCACNGKRADTEQASARHLLHRVFRFSTRPL
jgi:hypothetical protein